MNRKIILDAIGKQFIQRIKDADVLIEELEEELSTMKKTIIELQQTIEHYQANALRDQDLIIEMKDEISKLKHKANQLIQKRDGYVLLPEELTDEMIVAGRNSYLECLRKPLKNGSYDAIIAMYKAMIAAINESENE